MDIMGWIFLSGFGIVLVVGIWIIWQDRQRKNANDVK